MKDKRNKVRITIFLDFEIVEHFKKMSEESGIPYQSIINYYLLDSIRNKEKISIKFKNEENER